MRIRKPEPADARAIAEVEVASWKAAYRDLMPAHYLEALSVEAKEPVWRVDIEKHGPKGRKRVLVAEDGGRIVGFSLHGIPGGVAEGEGLLYLLYFVPEAWGRGFARPLLEAAMEDFRDQALRSAHLWVLTENARARRFYERAGWTHDGARTTDDYGGTKLEAMRYVTLVS